MFRSVDACKTKNMGLIHILEPKKGHIYEPNISLNSLINLMFNYSKPDVCLYHKY